MVSVYQKPKAIAAQETRYNTTNNRPDKHPPKTIFLTLPSELRQKILVKALEDSITNFYFFNNYDCIGHLCGLIQGWNSRMNGVHDGLS